MQCNLQMPIEMMYIYAAKHIYKRDSFSSILSTAFKNGGLRIFDCIIYYSNGQEPIKIHSLIRSLVSFSPYESVLKRDTGVNSLQHV